MDLLGPGRGFRGGEAVDVEESPAARIEQGQVDVSGVLVCHRVDVIARLDGDPQDWRSLADGRWGGLLLAPAAEDEEQEKRKCIGTARKSQAKDIKDCKDFRDKEKQHRSLLSLESLQSFMSFGSLF